MSDSSSNTTTDNSTTDKQPQEIELQSVSEVYVLFKDSNNKLKERSLKIPSKEILLITTDKEEYEKVKSENQQEDWRKVYSEYQNLVQSLRSLTRTAKYYKHFKENDNENIFTRTIADMNRARKDYNITDLNLFNDFLKSQIDYIKDAYSEGVTIQTVTVEKTNKKGKVTTRQVKKKIISQVEPKEYYITNYNNGKLEYTMK